MRNGGPGAPRMKSSSPHVPVAAPVWAARTVRRLACGHLWQSGLWPPHRSQSLWTGILPAAAAHQVVWGDTKPGERMRPARRFLRHPKITQKSPTANPFTTTVKGHPEMGQPLGDGLGPQLLPGPNASRRWKRPLGGQQRRRVLQWRRSPGRGFLRERGRRQMERGFSYWVWMSPGHGSLRKRGRPQRERTKVLQTRLRHKRRYRHPRGQGALVRITCRQPNPPGVPPGSTFGMSGSRPSKSQAPVHGILQHPGHGGQVILLMLGRWAKETVAVAAAALPFPLRCRQLPAYPLSNRMSSKGLAKRHFECHLKPWE